MRLVFLVVIAVFMTVPAFAQDKPSAKDAAAIQRCIKVKTGRNWDWENCIGIISKPCSKDEAAMPSHEVIACERREQAVWDNILNETFRSLLGKLDEAQQQKLREMQRAWIASRDKSCAFFYDYFEGSMANPMIAACEARETGRRALFLLGFLNDAEGK
ncbi:MAG TPA: lysozyme inhibitor LprI family protein [Pseudolabrys sp.]|nr:lysozyme inhibitor LprI family protein [Pseudolabrys sp.]